MDESTIASQVAQNLPQPNEPEPPKLIEQRPVGQAEQTIPLGLDELTVFKIHDFFGHDYRATDDMAIQQAKYVYTKVAELTGETDYSFIIEKMRELERIIGTANSANRMYKLYQWLKLDSIRRSTEAQMNALRNY